MPVVTFLVGGDAASLIRLPVIKPNVTEFDCNDGVKVYASKEEFTHSGGKWENHPCIQVYPKAMNRSSYREVTQLRLGRRRRKLVIDGPMVINSPGLGAARTERFFLRRGTR